MPQDQRDDMGNTKDQPNVEAASKHDWFKKPERPLTPDLDWNVGKQIDLRPPQTWINQIAKAEKTPLTFDELMSTSINFSAYVMNHIKIDNLTQQHLVGQTFNLLKGTCKSRVEHEYHFEECYKVVTDRLDWTNPEAISVKPCKEISSSTKIVAVAELPRSICPFLSRSGISKLTPYTAYKNPQGITYQDKLKRNRLIARINSTSSVMAHSHRRKRVLHDIASILEMDYLPKRTWSKLYKKRSRIMIKAIDQQLFERRLIRNLEKFVGGREYRNNFRLLERTI
ncbi:hypothetical protein Tco_0593847 [Tanacetum coccineum]